MGALVRGSGWWGHAGASLGVPIGGVVSGRDRKMGKGPESWVWAFLDGEVKAEALSLQPPWDSRQQEQGGRAHDRI